LTFDFFKLGQQKIIHKYASSCTNLKGAYAEAGVWNGDSAETICKVKGDKLFFLFDTFEGLPESEFTYVDTSTKFSLGYVAPGMYKGNLEKVRERLSKYPYVVVYKGLISETLHYAENMNFCFVHIDLDLYQPTLNALNFFYPRMIQNGIMLCHNYIDLPGPRKAIDEFFKDKPERLNGDVGDKYCLVKKM